MKINIQKILYRVIPFVTLLVVFISAVTPTKASAVAWGDTELIDYNDYIIRVSVDGENDACVVDLPFSMFRFGIIHNGNAVVGSSGSINTLRWQYLNDNGVDVYFQLADMYALMLSNIPSDSVLEFRVWSSLYDEETPEYEENYTLDAVVSNIQYLSSDHITIANKEHRNTQKLGVQGYHRYAMKISKPNGSYACRFGVRWENLFAVNRGWYEWTIDNINLVFNISSFYREGIHLEDNNDLLVIITGQLANNFQKQEDFYEYMEEEMGVTNDKVDELLDDYAVFDKKLNNIEVQNATIIQQNMDALENDQIMIDQNETMIEGSEEAQETVSWLEEYTDSVKEQMQEMGNKLDVDKPEIDIDTLTPGHLVDANAYSSYTHILTTLWGDPTIEQMAIVCVSLVLVSFIFFGKK